MKVKYCLLTNNNHTTGREHNYAAAGFLQWQHVFGGQVLMAAGILDKLKDGEYDLIHIRFCRENLGLIRSVREKLGYKAKTLLMVSIDIPVCEWKKERIACKEMNATLQNADFIFATEYRLAQAVMKRVKRTVYELPHPADIKKIQSYNTGNHDSDIITILFSRKRFLFKAICFLAGILGFRVRFLQYPDTDGKAFLWRKGKGEIRVCDNEQQFCEALLESKLVLAPFSKNNYGQAEIYAAALKRNVIGNNRSDALRRCYPFSLASPYNVMGFLIRYMGFKKNVCVSNYHAASAMDKAEYYNYANLQKRVYDFLYRETQDRRFIYNRQPDREKYNCLSFFDQINHLYGITNIRYRPDELVIVCLVKDGMEYLPAFLHYYRKMGIVHFIFIDNGSKDGTLSFLKQCDDVTLYSTSLEHKKYESEIRRVIIEEHCRERWCLCVDIDEFFDYPCSDKLPLPAFLKYLSGHGFTASICYMLDMCAREIVFSDAQWEIDIESEYVYYDISGIKRGKYFDCSRAFHNYNQLAMPQMPYYYGGIRASLFKNSQTKYLLMKHPLIFIDEKLEPVTDPHFCNKAHIADISCVLKHYKFTASFKNRVIKNLQEKNFAIFADKEHQAYYAEIKDKTKLNGNVAHLQKLNHVNDLVKNKFLYISEKYKKYVNSNLKS